MYFRTSYHSPIWSEAERLCSVCDFAPRPMRFCSANFAVRRWRHHVEELCRRQRCLGMQPCEGACLRCGSVRSPWHLCKNGRGGVIHNLQYIKMSHDCFCLYVVCVFVCQLRASSTYFGQLLRCAHKRIVNIMKVYLHIERNNMQVELIQFRKKY